MREAAPDSPRKTKRQRMAEQMLALLEQNAPAYGPQPGTPFSKSLGDNIFEFRIGYGQKHKGPKLRVTYFYGKDRRMIICVDRIWKRGEDMREAKRNAVQTRRHYLRDHANGNIQIFDLGDYGEPS